MKGVSSKTRRWGRLAPRGIWVSFAIFILTVVILRHWLEFYVSAVNAGAPSGIVASKQVWPVVKRHPAGKLGAQRCKNLSRERSGVPQTNASRVFAIKESGFPRVGLPTVPEASNLIEAWPGTHVIEAFAPPIQPSTPDLLLEAGDTSASGRKHTPVVPFAEAFACAVLGGICCLTRRLRSPSRRITR
jgi:hypothetical protein